MGQSKDKSKPTTTTSKVVTNKAEASESAPKAAKTVKLAEVVVSNPAVKQQLGLTDEPIFKVEDLSDVEVVLKQGDRKFTVGKEVIGE